MKRSIILYVIAAAIITFALIKIVNNRHKSKSLVTAATSQTFPADVFIARDTLVDYQVNSVGTLMANESVEIQSEVSQRLVAIQFHEGSYVEKGALLFKLDDATLQADLKKLIIQEELALQNENRSKVLLDKGGISQQVYDETLNKLKTIQADILRVKVDIDKTEINAPFSGRIGLRNVSEGAYIRPADILTTLDDISKIKLDFTVPERYAGSIRKGQYVSFTITGHPATFKAVIDAMQPSVDITTRNLKIRAIADNHDGSLIPGLSVKVIMDFPETRASIFVPTQCLIPNLKGYQVYFYRQGIVQTSQVKTGIRTKESVQILEGISAGDTVIMTNLLRLKPGVKIRIINTY